MDGAKRLSWRGQVAEPNFQRMERVTFSVVMGTIVAHWIMGSLGIQSWDGFLDRTCSTSGRSRWAPGSFVQGCYAYLTGGMEGTAVPFPIYHHDLWRVSLIDDCGCTDMNAVNFDSTANTDDGTCCYVAGCMDVTAVNYNEDACLSDGSCQDAILGCTDPESVDFDPAANTEVATGGPIDFSELGSGGFHYNDSWDMEFSVFNPPF